jgi:stage V sporulation protein SpoVS
VSPPVQDARDVDTPSMSWGSTGRAVSQHTAARLRMMPERNEPTLQAAGAGAVNQAVKTTAPLAVGW